MDSRCDVVGVSVCIVCTSAALHRPDDDAGVLILTSEFGSLSSSDNFHSYHHWLRLP